MMVLPESPPSRRKRRVFHYNRSFVLRQAPRRDFRSAFLFRPRDLPRLHAAELLEGNRGFFLATEGFAEELQGLRAANRRAGQGACQKHGAGVGRSVPAFNPERADGGTSPSVGARERNSRGDCLRLFADGDVPDLPFLV